MPYGNLLAQSTRVQCTVLHLKMFAVSGGYDDTIKDWDRQSGTSGVLKFD